MMGIESGFGHGDDDDYVEEELLVYADFQSKIASSTLRDTANVKIIGLETGEPIMEIGDKIFQGNFEHAMGTMLFFDENPIPPASLENYETVPDKWYKYLTKTDRVLRMNRIFVDAKSTTKDSQISANKDPQIIMDVDALASGPSVDISEVGAATGSSVVEAIKSAAGTDSAEIPHIPITKSYAMALSQFLKPGELPPRAPDMADEEFFRNFGTLAATLGDFAEQAESLPADSMPTNK